jgi:hypothetical protein
MSDRTQDIAELDEIIAAIKRGEDLTQFEHMTMSNAPSVAGTDTVFDIDKMLEIVAQFECPPTGPLPVLSISRTLWEQVTASVYSAQGRDYIEAFALKSGDPIQLPSGWHRLQIDIYRDDDAVYSFPPWTPEI